MGKEGDPDGLEDALTEMELPITIMTKNMTTIIFFMS